MGRSVMGGSAQPVHITGNDTGGTGLPISGTVGLDAASLAALETVQVASLPALPAGTNNIGDMDIQSLPVGARTFGTITVTASAVQASSVACRRAHFKARDGNAAAVSIGGSGVTTSAGYELLPGAVTPWFNAANLNEFYVIGANTSDKVDYVVEAA